MNMRKLNHNTWVVFRFGTFIKHFKNFLDKYEYICLKVIGSILFQYRELYLRNYGKLPTVLPSAEDQLTYIFEMYKKTMKRLEIYKNLKSGKMTVKDYISKAKA